MKFRRGKSSNKAKKGSSAPSQNGDKKVDGGVGSNSRQVAPETGFASIDYGSSRDDTFFEACAWLESDCEDDFYSVNGDLTPARSFTSQHNKTTPSGPPKLPTLGAILRAEPLDPPTPQRKLADLLRETQDDGDGGGADDLTRTDSVRMAEEANRCCVPQFAWAISCNGRGRRSI